MDGTTAGVTAGVTDGVTDGVTAGTDDCADAAVGIASIAAITHAAQDAKDVRSATGAPLSAADPPATREANGQRTANGSKCGERKTGLAARRLSKKDNRNLMGNLIGNVIDNVKEGRRDMPEILSPRRG